MWKTVKNIMWPSESQKTQTIDTRSESEFVDVNQILKKLRSREMSIKQAEEKRKAADNWKDRNTKESPKYNDYDFYNDIKKTKSKIFQSNTTQYAGPSTSTFTKKAPYHIYKKSFGYYDIIINVKDDIDSINLLEYLNNLKDMGELKIEYHNDTNLSVLFKDEENCVPFDTIYCQLFNNETRHVPNGSTRYGTNYSSKTKIWE